MEDDGSPDTSLGSPAAAGDYSTPGSPGGDYVPFVPMPWENNATDGPYYPGRVPLTWPARSGSGSGRSRASFGGLLSLILLHVLLVTSMAW
jgi:hypothetical protein